jgi:hypothetical protein
LLWKAYPVTSCMEACAASMPDAMLATICLICLINGNSVGQRTWSGFALSEIPDLVSV